MQAYPEIKAFVQQTLGCACPDTVFKHIEVDTGLDAVSHRIRVGGRLLVYLLDVARTADLAAAVAEAVRTGVSERNLGGYNRLRLVVVAPEPERIADEVEAAFSKSRGRDAQVHLHLLDTATAAVIQ